MPGQLVTPCKAALLLALLCLAAPAAAVDLAAGLLACRTHSDIAARLACYDALPAKPATKEFRGAGSQVTPPFDLAAPTLLQFESMDAIMVIYLLDASGAVIQNLHQAGAGTGSFLIAQPGSYRLQINASGGWRISLEAP